MKKLWQRVIQHGKLGAIEFIISILAIVASALLLILDLSGAIILDQASLLCIVIVLLGIVIGSSLIERYGILSSILENLIDPNETHAYITVRSQYERLHAVDECFPDITEMYIMAIANTSFLCGNGITRLKEAVKKGVKVKLLSLDPNSSLASFYETSSILSSVSMPLSGNIESYKNARRKSNKKFQDNITMKVCNKIIPYSLLILKKNGQVKAIKIDLYTNNVEYTDRRSIVIPPTDTEHINYFLSQWDYMWNCEDNKEIL